MTNSILRALCLLLASTVAGCYAQVEDENISYTMTDVCGTPPACTGNNALLTFTTNFVPAVHFNLGNSGVLTSSSSKQGPITFTGNLTLNQASIIMKTGSANFGAVRQVDVRAALNNSNCAQINDSCKSIASYDSNRDGPAGSTLVVKGSGVNLLDVSSGPADGGTGNNITMVVRATGNAPAVSTWQADLRLDMAIKARGNF